VRSVSGVVPEPLVEVIPPRNRRIRKIAIWLVALALFWFVLQELGVSVSDWLHDLWQQVKAIWHHNPCYIIGALVFQSGQTLLTGLSSTASSRPPTRTRSSCGRSSPLTPSALQ
jgi:hypothetical protein